MKTTKMKRMLIREQARTHVYKLAHGLAGWNSDEAAQRVSQNASYHETGRMVAMTVKTIVTKTLCM